MAALIACPAWPSGRRVTCLVRVSACEGPRTLWAQLPAGLSFSPHLLRFCSSSGRQGFLFFFFFLQSPTSCYAGGAVECHLGEQLGEAVLLRQPQDYRMETKGRRTPLSFSFRRRDHLIVANVLKNCVWTSNLGG